MTIEARRAERRWRPVARVRGRPIDPFCAVSRRIKDAAPCRWDRRSVNWWEYTSTVPPRPGFICHGEVTRRRSTLLGARPQDPGGSSLVPLTGFGTRPAAFPGGLRVPGRRYHGSIESHGSHDAVTGHDDL